MNDIEKSKQRWRFSALGCYLFICVFDFFIIPCFYGLTRPNISELMKIVNETSDTLVKLDLLKTLVSQHSPFTLMGGGLFHLAFGAILTGSAFGLNK